VGAANNGANPIRLDRACRHRVIGADGSLVGYGGGVPLKRKLLEHEARVRHTVRLVWMRPAARLNYAVVRPLETVPGPFRSADRGPLLSETTSPSGVLTHAEGERRA
jgi:hypothetical protein